MNRFENHLTNKRNSRLDSFLQKNLGHYGYVRYYEQGVSESKGNFLHCHLILTDEHLLMTQNPPKTLSLSIQLSDIHDIRLVPERHSVVIGSGPNVFTSQHVHVLSHKRPKSLTLTSTTSKLTPQTHQERPISNVPTKFRTGAFDLPMSLQLEYPFPAQPIQSHLGEKGPGNKEMPSLVGGKFSRGNADEESDSAESFKSLDTSSNGENGSFVQNRASSVLEQNLTSWRLTAAGVEEDGLGERKTEKRRPSSVDLGARPLTSRRGFLGKYLRVLGKQGKTEPNLIIVPLEDSQPIREYDEAHFHLYQSNSVFLNELFLYWNRQILKRTCQLDKVYPTDNEEIFRNLVLGARVQNDGAEEQDRFVDSVQNMTGGSMRLQLRHTRAQFYPLLCNFHQELRNDLSLQRICFQNSRFATSLLSILENTTQSRDSFQQSRKDWSRNLSEMLSVQLVLLDIFRMLIQTNTGTGLWSTGQRDGFISFGRRTGNNTNWNLIMETLINLTGLDTGESFGTEIQDVLTDPQRFHKGDWRTHPEANVISLLALKFTISVSLLYEITSLFLYTPGDHPLTSLLLTIQTAPFLAQIVTQIFSLILTGAEMPMSSAQTVTLYHQVSVLRILMNNSPTSFPTGFLRQNFSEEFKYFVNGESLRERIPNEYPIKAKTISVFNTIRTEILQPTPKS